MKRFGVLFFLVGIVLAAGVWTPEANGQGLSLIFPFPPGTTWRVLQGYNGPATHNATYPDGRYALDLQLVEKDSRGNYVVNPAKTRGQPVLAAADGEVVWVESATGCVLLRHDPFTETQANGQKKYYFTMYCHLEPPGVKAGDRRKQGEAVGKAGATGVTSGEPHIHFHLFSTLGHPLGEDQAGRTQAERVRVRIPEPLVQLRGWVVRDAAGRGDYLKEGWPATGETNQYSGWIVENRLSPLSGATAPPSTITPTRTTLPAPKPAATAEPVNTPGREAAKPAGMIWPLPQLLVGEAVLIGLLIVVVIIARQHR